MSTQWSKENGEGEEDEHEKEQLQLFRKTTIIYRKRKLHYLLYIQYVYKKKLKKRFSKTYIFICIVLYWTIKIYVILSILLSLDQFHSAGTKL